MKEIEQMGKVLSKILAELIGHKTNDVIEHGIKVTQAQFKTELDIDIEALLALPKAEMKTYLIEHKVTPTHFNIIQEYFKEIGEDKIAEHKAEAKIYLSKSLELLELDEEASKTVSYERLFVKSEIKGMLNQCV